MRDDLPGALHIFELVRPPHLHDIRRPSAGWRKQPQKPPAAGGSHRARASLMVRTHGRPGAGGGGSRRRPRGPVTRPAGPLYAGQRREHPGRGHCLCAGSPPRPRPSPPWRRHCARLAPESPAAASFGATGGARAPVVAPPATARAVRSSLMSPCSFVRRGAHPLGQAVSN